LSYALYQGNKSSVYFYFSKQYGELQQMTRAYVFWTKELEMDKTGTNHSSLFVRPIIKLQLQ
jgi:hypothetical protein